MRGAYCVICTESLDGSSDISAVRCGHVFHSSCLSRWLSQSSTCPQCREKVPPKSVISKLFFARADGSDTSIVEDSSSSDLSRVLTDLESARCKLTQRVQEVDKLTAENCKLSNKIEQLSDSSRALEALHCQELDNNKLLRQQLSVAQNSARQAITAREEAMTLRNKLVALQNVQTFINGFQDEIDELIRQTKNVGDLATWCAVCKTELARKRTECQSLSDTIRHTRRERDIARSTLTECTSELAAANKEITSLKEEVAAQDRQISGLQKKLSGLQAAIESPSDTRTGVVWRLMNESPAPSTLDTPTLKPPCNMTREIDLNESVDLFSPEPPAPPRKRLRHLSESNVSDATLTSAAIGCKVQVAATVTSHRAPFTSSNYALGLGIDGIRKKLKLGGTVLRDSDTSQFFREGYNGLGGHEKVVVPPPRTQLQTTCSFKKPSHLSRQFLGPSKTSKSPQQATLVKFINVKKI